MVQDDPKTLVSTNWLKANLKHPNLRVLDASWHLPTENRDPAAEFALGHIPTARFFDIDDISDHRSALPHMVPPVEKFMSRVRALGVGDGHHLHQVGVVELGRAETSITPGCLKCSNSL